MRLRFCVLYFHQQLSCFVVCMWSLVAGYAYCITLVTEKLPLYHGDAFPPTLRKFAFHSLCRVMLCVCLYISFLIGFAPLSVSYVCNIDYSDVRWIIGKILLVVGLNLFQMLSRYLRGRAEGSHRYLSIWIVYVVADVVTRVLQNTSLGHYRYSHLLCNKM